MSKLLNCLKGKNKSGIPVWFMRQAGRHLPEFRKIRKKNKDFIKLCLNSDLSSKITLQPINRYKLDAAIIFSDILIVPYALGQNIKFKKNIGPILTKFDLKCFLKKNKREFLKSLKSLASESYSTVNTPTQYASVEAYANEHKKYKLKVRAILKAVGNYVYNNLKSNKILIAPPQGAFYLMPEFKNKKYKTSSELCNAILNDTGVAMLPGSDFGFKPKKMLTRLSYTDFDGVEFYRNVTNCKMIDDEMIKNYAPNVVEGVSKLSNWVKNL